VQERDAFQDYSPNTVALYRQYLRSIHGGIAHWNTRWGTKFADWASFRPPPLHMHGPRWNDTLTDPSYWDWQHFRHHHIHEAHEHCCQHFAAHGFRCIMHFGEFFSANDAIYASGSVFTLAASPWLDYIVVDSNFVTAAMLPNDPRVVQLLLSAMKPFGKPVFFEGAFEEIKDPLVHRRAVELTVGIWGAWHRLHELIGPCGTHIFQRYPQRPFPHQQSRVIGGHPDALLLFLCVQGFRVHR
jgi:hypothetical protein